jgi:LysR family glycine cleavage system transcriptional activator
MRRFPNIPPLQFLHGFEAAARLGSFSKAAAELGLSQSAVSHQMRLLEDRIGQPLFRRSGRAVHLTDAGRDYQRTVRRSLDQLESGYRRLAPYRKPGSVVIYAASDFAHRWLLPRLSDMIASCPGCEPWIDSSGLPVDFAEMEVSIAITYGPEPPPGHRAIRLAGDRRAPVIARERGGRRRLRPRELLGMTLLHDERPVGWAEWFQLADVAADEVSSGLDFSDSDLALVAAEQGLGAALASLPLAAPAIAAGRLAQPFSLALDPRQSWFAVSTDQELNDASTAAVWRWFERAAAPGEKPS